MFHLLKVLIINALCYKNETWNKKRLKVNIMYAYVRARKERVLTSRQRVLTSRQRVLTWGRRVPPGEDASPAYLYIYAWNNPIYVLQYKT